MIGDCQVDVWISRPGPGGARQHKYCTSSQDLVETLRSWKGQGTEDISLTWGRTPDPAIRAVEEMIRSVGVEYTTPSGKGRGNGSSGPLTTPAADAGPGPPGQPSSGPEGATPGPMARPVQIISTGLLFIGCVALTAAIWSALSGSLSIGSGILGLPIGYGLLRRKAAWREVAVVLGLLDLLATLVWVCFLLHDRSNFSTLWADTLAPPLGETLAWCLLIGYVLATAFVAASVWVLTRPRVRRLFTHHPARGRQRLLAWLVVLAGITLCRETGGLDADLYTATSKGTGNEIEVGAPAQDYDLIGFTAPCVIELQGEEVPALYIIDKFLVTEEDHPEWGEEGWEGHCDWHWQRLGGLAARAAPAELKGSPDRLIVRTTRFDLAGPYWLPVVKRAELRYAAAVEGRGKYARFADRVQGRVEYTALGLCSAHRLREDLRRIVELEALGLVRKSATTSSTARALNSRSRQLVICPPGQRDAAAALPLAQRAVEIKPDNPRYINTLGVVLYRNGQPRQALAALDRSLELGKGKYDAFNLYVLAMCHARLGDAAKAHDCFDRASRWEDEHRNELLPESRRPGPRHEEYKLEEIEILREEARAELKSTAK